MRVRVLAYNKYGKSVDDFEKELQAIVEQDPAEVTGMQVSEAGNGDIIFVLEFGGPKSRPQSACILAWLGIDQVGH